MTDITSKVREHYSATNLTDRIKSALATTALEDQTLTVARLESSTRVLDVGCGTAALHAISCPPSAVESPVSI
jgi:cyclopropane fatty-acyl-phospholipid synthase-like methyltransferase